MYILALNQLGETFWCALETQSLIVEADNRKNLAADLEAEILTPLQILGSPREGQAKFANGVDIH